jgi:hypothetical protein
MTFDALEHRDVPEIYRVPELFVGLVTRFALSICEPAEIDRMLEIDRSQHC